MRWSFLILLLMPACARLEPAPHPVAPASPVLVLDSRIADSIERLRHYSEPFRTEWDALGRAGTPIVIGTDRQLDRMLPAAARQSPSWVGTTSLEPAGRVAALSKVVVVIRLDLLERLEDETYRELHDGAPGDQHSFELALDYLVTHELFGHVIPAARAGLNFHPCTDWVRPGETVSCADERASRIHLPAFWRLAFGQ